MSRSGVRFPEAAPPLTSEFPERGAAEQAHLKIVWSRCGRSARGALVHEPLAELPGFIGVWPPVTVLFGLCAACRIPDMPNPRRPQAGEAGPASTLPDNPRP